MLSESEIQSTIKKSRQLIATREKIVKKFEKTVRKLNAVDQTVLKASFDACVIFGQEEAGSGVIIDENGIILTCAHCVENSNEKLIVLFDGTIVVAEVSLVDVKCDTALLKISGRFNSNTMEMEPLPNEFKFPFVSIANDPPDIDSLLFCVGQPAEDDLESQSARKTGYPIIDLSVGTYLGVKKGNVHNNFTIGKLMHDCWTYWGHSGAPLLNSEGKLCGMHSSWDESTGTRRGIHYEAIKAFLNHSSSKNRKRKLT